MNARNITYHLGMAVVIFGGIILGGVPLLIGLILGFMLRSYSLSRIIAICIVALLFVLSWSYQGFESTAFKVSLHDSYFIGENNSPWLNAILCIFFAVLGNELAKSIGRHHEKNTEQNAASDR